MFHTNSLYVFEMAVGERRRPWDCLPNYDFSVCFLFYQCVQIRTGEPSTKAEQSPAEKLVHPSCIWHLDWHVRVHPGDLRRNGVWEPDASMWVDLWLLQRNSDCFTFIHVCIQEFCASMLYLLRQPQDNANSAIRSVAQLLKAIVTQAPTYLLQMGIYLSVWVFHGTNNEYAGDGLWFFTVQGDKAGNNRMPS